ncbi:MAG: hypothetical protein M0Z62_14685 [Actinomycetota bacterium]|nr:hypothetical protein [Actinomycetota bacterium]MDA8381394.1 hypothetical protein [Actinomycetota bacterium]
MIATSGVARLLEELMPSGGRPRQLRVGTVLLAMAFSIDEGRPAHLMAGWRTLEDLPGATRLRLGSAVTRTGTAHDATYRQFSHTYRTMMGTLDPAPVPSFRGVAEEDRAAHLHTVRAGIDTEARQERLERVLDQLVEASVPNRYKSLSCSLAVDWTDHETWSRPRARDDPVPAPDPTASWGHAKRNAPGAKDQLFFGYYGQVATMVKEERGPSLPEFVRRIAFHSPRTDPPKAMAATLVRAYADGVSPGDVLCDCGYSNRDPKTFASPLRRAGAALVMDLHPTDRGPRGTHCGAIISNGSLYCPAVPKALLELGPLPRQASAEEAAAHDEKTKELSRYKLGRIAGDDEGGTHRVMCPAAMGKCRCALRPESMALDYTHPEVVSPPEDLPTCCVQKTISVRVEIDAKRRQKHDYPSKAHRFSYNRRTGSERTFSWFQDPATGGIRRGWSRLFGRAPNALMYALCAVVRNVRLALAAEDREAEAARRAAMGPSPLRRRRRRRRHGRPEHASSEPADGAPEPTPG